MRHFELAELACRYLVPNERPRAGRCVGDVFQPEESPSVNNAVTHGFVDRHGKFQSVDVPGSTATTINGINDLGQIVGFFTDANGNTLGFVGTPES